MSEDPRIKTIRGYVLKNAHKGGHHPRCATKDYEGCDCYARAFAPVLHALDSLAADLEVAREALEMAWVVIANASGGDWTKQPEGWQVAASRWRDNYFHPALARLSAGKETGDE